MNSQKQKGYFHHSVREFKYYFIAPINTLLILDDDKVYIFIYELESDL
jgi:hypothetical protein